MQMIAGIVQAYSKPCVILAYLEPRYIQNRDISKTRNIFRTLVYSDARYIHNFGILKTQGIFRHLQRQTSTMTHFIKIAENSFPI